MSLVLEKARFIRSCIALPLVIVPAGCDFGDEGADAGAATGGGTQNSTVCMAEFTPCGGDLTGTWTVQATCGVINPADTVNANFAAYPNCSRICTGAAETTSGTKTYASSGTLTSTEAFQMVETLDQTPACFNDVTQTTLTDSTCQAESGQSASTSASCGITATGCGCQITQVTNNDATSYQISGTSLTELGATGLLLTPAFEYCVVGNTMTQRRTLPPGGSFVVTYVRH
jgi:hypothetical protein